MTGWLVAAAVAWAGYYAIACAWFPYANCWCCKGGGKHKSRNGKTFRRCRVCGGKGSWFRVGVRVWNWYRNAGS